MPICTSCTHPTPYLYTVYQSAYNLRLEQCTACHAFADPYVEHDTLTLLLDLILLKRDVYRHLLFNRGLGARKVGQGGRADAGAETKEGYEEELRHINDWGREKTRRWLIVKLGLALISVDAFIRWTHLSASNPFVGRGPDGSEVDLANWNRTAVEGFLRIFVGCLVETVAFHVGIVIGCFTVLNSLHWARTLKLLRFRTDPQMSGIRQEFRYSHVPLTLLYSSLTKLLLLFLLSIWRPTAPSPANHAQALHPNAKTFTHPVVVRALEILDEDKLDREWVVRNVLGGMSAGFGLRVVLDCPPVFTTLIILGGWVVKTAMANLVKEWVGAGLGGDETAGEMWLAYSIP
ncbi:Arv1-domain-containing protein [Sparassis crispa]|uniref:Protein ARV n=1 Tax=Sparassis crispa TaxID=139825 RepID=A0A401H2K1_9APHY|nr:Arv1-domain-containing protein [Sparassis crispa]GBE88590.1 Arv1-domain-containing protein [Sparassis crispa]